MEKTGLITAKNQKELWQIVIGNGWGPCVKITNPDGTNILPDNEEMIIDGCTDMDDFSEFIGLRYEIDSD